MSIVRQTKLKINLERAERGFEILNSQYQKISEDSISSGESELIALSIEVLVFSRSKQENKILLLDEPDVHLHPDLQHKFVEFVERIANEFDFRVVFATHSTAIIGAFSKNADLQIVPITDKDQIDFPDFKYDPICHEILPIFGSHPLSSHFNRTPVLLVEGEDDKRVFEQIMRSSLGADRDTIVTVKKVGTVVGSAAVGAFAGMGVAQAAVSLAAASGTAGAAATSSGLAALGGGSLAAGGGGMAVGQAVTQGIVAMSSASGAIGGSNKEVVEI